MMSAGVKKYFVFSILIICANILYFCKGYPASGAIVFPKDDEGDHRYMWNTSKEKSTTSPTTPMLQSRSGVLNENRQQSLTGNNLKNGGARIYFKDPLAEKNVASSGIIHPQTTSVKPPLIVNRGNSSRVFEDDEDEEDYDPRYLRALPNCRCFIGSICADTDDC